MSAQPEPATEYRLNRPPIALFVYNRPGHTQQTLDALSRNEGASEHDLIVFSDGPKQQDDRQRVDEVRRIVEDASGFRSVSVVERPLNTGLAENIVGGVSSVLDDHPSVIVLEDDIVTGRGFLSSMTSALDRYETEQEVWHINGWFYPTSVPTDYDTFFLRTMLCWGWATWKDRWIHYRREPVRLVNEWTSTMKQEFDLDSGQFWPQVVDNRDGVIHTWAIFWYATIFEAKGLCLTPKESLTHNIGNDGTGVHSGASDQFDVVPSDMHWSIFPGDIVEDASAVRVVEDFLHRYRPGLLGRAQRRIGDELRRLGLRTNS